MIEKQIILSNCPSSEYWDDNSFIGNLHENEVWINEKYLSFELVLYTFSERHSASEITWELFKIFSILMSFFISHFDENDFSQIKNLSQEQIYSAKERVQLVFDGFFQGRMHDRNFFDDLLKL